MKCPNCDGKGTVLKIIYEDWQKDEIVRSAVKCPRCNGSGELPMTNEEWFCQLPTYKKAILMANCYDAFNLDQYACNKHVVIEEWLKQPHTFE